MYNHTTNHLKPSNKGSRKNTSKICELGSLQEEGGGQNKMK